MTTIRGGAGRASDPSSGLPGKLKARTRGLGIPDAEAESRVGVWTMLHQFAICSIMCGDVHLNSRLVEGPDGPSGTGYPGQCRYILP